MDLFALIAACGGSAFGSDLPVFILAGLLAIIGGILNMVGRDGAQHLGNLQRRRYDSWSG
jgi:hypothetical protein